MITKFFRYLFLKPNWLFAKSPVGKYLSDETFLKIKYKHIVGENLNLREPIGFNEKIQWLKLNYRMPILTKLVDKFEVKNYVSDLIGEKYIIENYGVWNSFDEIDFSILPNQFVLKTTHDCGGVVICKDKESFDFKEAKDTLDKHLKNNHFFTNREWAYKHVVPRIIAEKYFTNGVVNNKSEELVDYKFSCFNGEPKLLQISSGRFDGTLKHDFFDMSFRNVNISKSKKDVGGKFEEPLGFHVMKDLAQKMSEGFPFVRVDFYDINGQVYFGEFTFYPGGGFSPFEPKEWEKIAGDWIDLSDI